MPFLQRQLNGQKETDRTLTGIPPPPQPGRAQTESGMIVGSLADPAAIKAATEIPVSLPGPREPVVSKDGTITPIWYRFFQELYRRTGGTQDNVNFIPVARKLAPGTPSLTLTGLAPSIDINHFKTNATASLSLTGAAPSITVA